MQRDPKVTVGVLDPGHFAEDFHLESKFLPHLAPRRIGRSLSGFHLSTRELPQTAQQSLLGPSSDQQSRSLPHEGGGDVKFQEWDGKKWNVITDWIKTDQSIVRPMIEASAAKYAGEKGIKLREGKDSYGSDCTMK